MTDALFREKPQEVKSPPQPSPKPKPKRTEERDMKEAPRTGIPIMATEDGETWSPAVWRVTRRFEPKKGLWVSTGFWALHNGGGTRLGFEPLAWKPYA